MIATRTQADTPEQRDLASDASGLDCSKDPYLVREEFAKESDPNELIRRFMSGEDLRKFPSVYGERDMDLDLQRGLNALDDARSAFGALPRVIQEFYGHPANWISAVADGTFPEHWNTVQSELDAKKRADTQAQADAAELETLRKEKANGTPDTRPNTPA